MNILSQAEREYFIRKLNKADSNLKRTTQIKREYFIFFLGQGNPNVSLRELEDLWIDKTIFDAGGTEVESEGDEWKTMVALIGKTPSEFINSNKLTFYLNAS